MKVDVIDALTCISRAKATVATETESARVVDQLV
jgi:hypothetical protein